MGQVTIYLDDITESKMLKLVEKSGISKSKWISRLIHEKTSTTWPESVKKLAGEWKDLPLADEIRTQTGKDAERESI